MCQYQEEDLNFFAKCLVNGDITKDCQRRYFCIEKTKDKILCPLKVYKNNTRCDPTIRKQAVRYILKNCNSAIKLSVHLKALEY